MDHERRFIIAAVAARTANLWEALTSSARRWPEPLRYLGQLFPRQRGPLADRPGVLALTT